MKTWATDKVTLFAQRCKATKDRLREQYNSLEAAQMLIDSHPEVGSLEDALHIEAVTCEHIRLKLEANLETAEKLLLEYCKGKKTRYGTVKDEYKTNEYYKLDKDFKKAFKALKEYNKRMPVPYIKPSWRN